MRKTNSKQEILLVTTSTFAQRDLCAPKSAAAGKYIQQLEEACWNGFVADSMPEMMVRNGKGKSLSLWKIYAVYSFLCMEMAEKPDPINHEYSINPYLFFTELSNN